MFFPSVLRPIFTASMDTGLRRTICLLVASFLLPIVALAKISIPQQGAWTLDGKTRSAFIKTFRDKADIVIAVNPCGDQINIVHPSLIPNGIIYLQHDGADYVGAGWYKDKNGKEGALRFKLTAKSSTVIKGDVFIDLGELPDAALAKLAALPASVREFARERMEAAMKQEWAVTITAVKKKKKTESMGHGELRVMDVSNSTDGVFRIEAIQYQLVLSDFQPQSYDLLLLHRQWLDTAIAIGTSELKGEPPGGGIWCEKTVKWEQGVKSPDWNYNKQIVGFSDRSIEKKEWKRWSTGRAQVTLDYFKKSAMGAPMNFELAKDGPDYVGAAGLGGSSCMRAAVASFGVLTRTAIPYTKMDTEIWLEQWLKQVHPMADSYAKAGELGGLPPLKTENESERTLWRQDAKERHCFANGLLERLKSGQCARNPSIDYEGLGGESGGTRDGIARAYQALPKAAEVLAFEATGKDRSKGAGSFCSQASKDAADVIERRFFEENTKWGTETDNIFIKGKEAIESLLPK